MCAAQMSPTLRPLVQANKKEEEKTILNCCILEWVRSRETSHSGGLKTARNLANSTNQSLRNSNPSFFKGLEIHEIQPVKFNGSPTDLTNKLFLSPTEHKSYTKYWAGQQYNWFK